MGNENKLLASKLKNIHKNVLNKARTCMFSDCQNSPIKSHVLQKNGILNQIAINQHLITTDGVNPFKTHEGIPRFARIGINDVYTFNGFCNHHDTEIFKPIENSKELDFNNPYHQTLFSYRALCQEIYRKEIGAEYQKRTSRILPRDVAELQEEVTKGFETGLRNLNFYKIEFEKAINSGGNENPYVFKVVTVPKTDVCISVPLNIDTINDDSINNEIARKSQQPPYFPTSFLNWIPYGENSKVIVGYHKDHPCSWTDRLFDTLMRADHSEVYKILSDLIVLRLEFWAMSPTLFQSIPKSSLETFKEIWTDNIFNHSDELTTELNLFSHVK